MSDWPSSGTPAPGADVPRGSGAPRDAAPSVTDGSASPGAGSAAGSTGGGSTGGSTGGGSIGGGSGGGPTAGSMPPGEQPPGLREQFRRTRTAAVGLIAAHIDLAKAEFGEIIGEIKRAVMLGSVALGFLFVAATIFTVGTVLWLDEWWFGSIGWGALHGTEVFVALAVLLLLAIIDLGTGRIVGSFVIAAVVGIVIGVVLGLDYRAIGNSNFTGLAEATRPLALGAAAGAVIVGVFGLVLGAYGGGARGALGGLVFGAILGAILGAIGSAKPGVQVASAVGVAIFFLLWPIMAAIFVFRHGIDTDKLKDRFVPDQTIDTTKETIEWVRAQTPLGRKS